MDKKANSVITVTHQSGVKYLVDTDLIIAASIDHPTGFTHLVSFTGPIMPVKESAEHVMQNKTRSIKRRKK